MSKVKQGCSGLSLGSVVVRPAALSRSELVGFAYGGDRSGNGNMGEGKSGPGIWGGRRFMGYSMGFYRLLSCAMILGNHGRELACGTLFVTLVASLVCFGSFREKKSR